MTKKNPIASKLLTAAQAGDIKAQCKLADHLREGNGIAQNLEAALHWYRQAASGGDPEAMNNVGSMLLNGMGTEADEKGSVPWFQAAAEKGNAVAQFNLGVRYLHGSGVEQSDPKAFYWIDQAAKQNHAEALGELGTLYRFGRGTEPDLVHACGLHIRAALLGDAVAHGNLSGYHDDLKKLALQGNRQIAFSLCQMSELGLGVEKNPALSWAWQRWAHDDCPPMSDDDACVGGINAELAELIHSMSAGPLKTVIEEGEARLSELRIEAGKYGIGIINYPTPDELHGNQDKPSAKEKSSYAAKIEHDAEFSKNHLESPSQLPMIAADPLILVWDIEFDGGGETAGPSYTTIKYEGQVIWRELAYYECVDRFNEVVKILREKYGDRLKALIPTGRSETHLYGDIISPSGKALEISTSFPILGIKALAESGDQGALKHLRYEREFATHHLERVDQLPDVSGDFLVLSWDLAESPPRVSVRVSQDAFHYKWDRDRGDGFLYVALNHEGRELWREAASTQSARGADGELRFDLADRYGELAAIAKSKYGDRLKDIVPSLRSDAYYGGSLVGEAVEKSRSRHFPASEDDVLNLWSKAVAGYLDAQIELSDSLFLGEGFPQDSARAAYWCRQAADQGDSYAQSGLGILYENGDGVPQDDVEALTWFRKAANQGEPYSQFALGVRYRSGAGVPQDYGEALHWLRKAAEQGQVDAQSTLGSMYESGQGVPQDYVQAYLWLDKAAGNDPESLTEECREARKNLNAVAAKMTKAQRAKARRLVREKKPTLHLLPGSKTNDFQALMDFFKAVTGREITAQELEEARATFDTHKEKDDK